MAEAKPSPLDVTIVGAGLAGLAAAVSCSLAGHKVLVVEAARELAEVQRNPRFFSLPYRTVQY